MADDTLEIREPFDFHPCNSPRGMLYYDLQDLTSDQQIQLNKLKRNSVRDNEKYLASHPQIRGIIALISRHVFLHRPRTDLPEFIGRFFLRPKLDIEKEVDEYIIGRDPHVYEGDSAVGLNLLYKKEDKTILSPVLIPEEEVEEEDSKNIPKEFLNEIIERALTQLEARDWRSCDSDEKITVIKEVISDIISKALNDKERILSYLYKSNQDIANYESTIATWDDLTSKTDISTASSDSDTGVKNVSEIDSNEKKLEMEHDPSEATEMAVGSQEIINFFEEESHENFLESQVIDEQPLEVVEQLQETVEEPQAAEASQNEAPAEEPT